MLVRLAYLGAKEGAGKQACELAGLMSVAGSLFTYKSKAGKEFRDGEGDPGSLVSLYKAFLKAQTPQGIAAAAAAAAAAEKSVEGEGGGDKSELSGSASELGSTVGGSVASVKGGSGSVGGSVLSKSEAQEAGKKWCEEKGVVARCLGYATLTTREILKVIQGTSAWEAKEQDRELDSKGLASLVSRALLINVGVLVGTSPGPNGYEVRERERERECVCVCASQLSHTRLAPFFFH